MKKLAITILFSFITASSCAPQTRSDLVPPTPTARPRPWTEYELGIWHSQIASEIMREASTIHRTIGEPDIAFDVQILPATSVYDELIIVKYANWPQGADLAQVWYWLFLSIRVQADRYKLHPQTVIAAEFATTPYGEFTIENDNIEGFCEIPWSSLTAYTSPAGGRSLDDATRAFLDTWDCAYR